MALNPRFVGNLRFLAASLAASGQFREARQVGQDLLRLTPRFSAGQVRRRAMRSRMPTSGGWFGEHLVLAGLPE